DEDDFYLCALEARNAVWNVVEVCLSPSPESAAWGAKQVLDCLYFRLQRVVHPGVHSIAPDEMAAYQRAVFAHPEMLAERQLLEKHLRFLAERPHLTEADVA